ncbi:MAG: PrsW family intramembrane metalloprotease [Chloroflexi bacterium]|nr:PrsW family intramembrane metalloprotease [Chloroflexota bacterium]
MVIYLALGVAFLFPLGFLYFIRRGDLYGTGKFHINIVTLVWGMVAYLLAAQINPAVINAGWATRDQVIRVVAPILEEFLKAIILIYLVQRADFNYVVDGAIYGFGAGIGFAIIENYEYVSGHPEIAMSIAIARVLSTNLIHATGSGVIGTVLAFRRGELSWMGWLAVLLGYVFSMAFHIGFNTMVSMGRAPLLLAIVFGFTGLGLIWYAIKRGLNVQKNWVGEKLGMGDRVTKSEATVVRNIEDLSEVLTPIEKQFGAAKVPIVEGIIRKQAEIGIKRKLLEKTPSESKRKEIEEIIASLGMEMDVLRREAGSYCMMFVRTVYLEQDIKIWDAINSRIAEQNTGQKGGGLFDRATTRMKHRPSEEEKS